MLVTNQRFKQKSSIKHNFYYYFNPFVLLSLDVSPIFFHKNTEGQMVTYVGNNYKAVIL